MAKADAPVADTTAGRVRGAWKDKGRFAVFRGIPYAAPPVGARRWRAPERPAPWDGIRDARKNGPTAMQRATMIEEFMGGLLNGHGWSRPRVAVLETLMSKAPTPPESEDCLSLTVRTPELDPQAKLPVMVWIHGGDHQDGSNAEIFYASNALAGHGVVTVTINYRLGLMGYFAHPELADEASHGTQGNYGTLDQIAALEWVRDNIAWFGGDPGNVTVFGESAGGESVMHMMTSPLARGLFHRAIAQSPANSGQMIHLRRPFLDYDSAETTSEAFASALGFTGTDQVSRLRDVSADDLYALVRAAPRLGDHFPTIDGHVLPESPLAAFAGGRQAPVPLTIGSNADEGSLIQPIFGSAMIEYRYRPIPDDGIQPEMCEAFGDDIDDLARLYPGLERGDAAAEIAFLGDHMFGQRAFWYARHHAASGSPAWLYFFARNPPGDGQTIGAYHAAELPFVHGSNVPIFPMTDDDKELAGRMQKLWTAFAATGDPNSCRDAAGGDGQAVPSWPRFDSAAPQWLRLDHRITAEPIDRLDKYEILGRRTQRLVDAMSAAVAEPA